MGMRSGEVTPPFLRKVYAPTRCNQCGEPPFDGVRYHMVDDASCEDIVSWSEEGTQFTIHQISELASELLPKYFKHSNFSSFVRQLNSYGFRKVKNTCWSFANVHFRKGHEEELMNIKRRMGAKGRGEAGSGVGSDGGKGLPEGMDWNAFEERQRTFETRLHQEIQIYKLEVGHLVHRIANVQEELLRILINPTAQLDEAARGGSGYGDAPVTVNSVLESLYKQMRDVRGGGSIGNPYGGRGPGGIGVAGGPADFNRMAAANAGIAAATQAGMAAGIANPAFLGIYDPAQIEAFYQGARSGNNGGGGGGNRNPNEGSGQGPMY